MSVKPNISDETKKIADELIKELFIKARQKEAEINQTTKTLLHKDPQKLTSKEVAEILQQALKDYMEGKSHGKK